jgi:hypothetical protein
LPFDVRKKRLQSSYDGRKEGHLTPRQNDELLQGTLDMLVLKALQLGSMHGWGITERLAHGSEDVLQIGQGSLYPALYRLERQKQAGDLGMAGDGEQPAGRVTIRLRRPAAGVSRPSGCVAADITGRWIRCSV